MSNQLQHEKSPYLLQHKDNPVHWRPWGSEAFAMARAENKPIFLSIGYSTCHWCHVMAHESFEDEDMAAVINRAFVPIKVDREERPDVDAVYMEACIAMNGSGGWPLTVLLTPDQKPFWAGTYLPKAALLSLLSQVEDLWNNRREALLAAGAQLTDYLRQESKAGPGTPSRALAAAAMERFARSFDEKWGGFGTAPKFPMAHNLIFLMRYARCSGQQKAMDMTEKTMEAMYRGGLFDHVGGGFSRYSTDNRWLVPHFEKMLYDNALLLFAYTEAFQRTGRPLYETVARRTAEYVLRELENPDGGFFCGQDADSEGVEGKYYVFRPAEVRAALGEDRAKIFCSRYGITEKDHFEGGSIPNLIGAEDPEREPEEMDAIREDLRRWRLERTTLHKDDKILTAWNGLMIAALAKAGLVFQMPQYLDAAGRAVEFIKKHLTDPQGRLQARWRDGERAINGKLDDYAFYCWGLLELYEASSDLRYLSEAQRLAARLLEDFFDWEKGGLYPYASDDEQLITRSKEVHDGAMPSGNSVAALVFSRLDRLTGNARWREAARLQFSFLAGAVRAYPAGYSFSMLAMVEELWPSAQLICAGKEIPAELRAFLRNYTGNALRVLVKTPENRHRLSELAPFTREYPIPEQGTQYYLCTNGACRTPTGSLSEIQAQLETL